MIWMPSYLAKSLGFSLTKSGVWTAVTVVGMAFGIWAFGQLADQVGRKPIFILFQLGAVTMLFVYSPGHWPEHAALGGSNYGDGCETERWLASAR